MVTTPRGEGLSEVSTMIGELRNFAAVQVTTNSHMLEELRKIGDRLSGLGEVSATFTEFRKTNHERWNRVHAQIADIDDMVEKIEVRLRGTETAISEGRAQVRVVVAVAWLSGTLVSSFVAHFADNILKALVR